MPHARRRATLALLLTTVLPAVSLAACDAGPTAPTSYAHVAGGRTWVAVALPDGLPDARAWTPFVPRASAAFKRLEVLHDEEAAARRSGNLELAQKLADEQARMAARAARITGPEPLLRAGAALDRWDDRVRTRLAAGAYPQLDSARVQVGKLRSLARLHGATGDTAAAAAALTEAACIARSWAPRAVGLRLLADADARLAAAKSDSEGLRHARGLLRSAREALATGDDARAVKRATYALEILDAELPRAAASGPPAG
jgi:hypothetical protein